MIAVLFLAAAAVGDPISGTWEGTSLCQVKPSPCHDEHVIYRVARLAPQKYRIDAFRSVGGKKIFMGPIDVTFEPSRHLLAGSFPGPRGTAQLRLSLVGKHLRGTMALGDGTLYRLIEVDKR